MKICQLNKEEYITHEFVFEYTTDAYLDIVHNDNTYMIIQKKLDKPIIKMFKERLFQDYWDNPIAYGAFIDEALVGIIEGTHETWNNRFRITNILVMKDYRRQGVGHILMKTMVDYAKSLKARMVVLETQSCNIKAISFYKKEGFQIIGFDLYCYSNDDLEKNEVRIEMGKII